MPVSQEIYTPERIVWKPETVPSDFAKAVKKEQMSPHSRCVSREPLGFQYSFLILGHNRQPLTMPFGIIRESSRVHRVRFIPNAYSDDFDCAEWLMFEVRP